MHSLPPLPRLLAAALVLLALAACAPRGDIRQPLPTRLVAAPQPGAERSLVVVLPGYADSVEDLAAFGIAEAIQAGWPEADVMLTGAAIGYYRAGQMPARVHDEVIAPARADGYREIWLVGASMGGMGVVLYERAHPGELDGLVLFAPFVGRGGLLREIGEAGGARAWDPGPAPPAMDASNFQREMWRDIRTWPDTPGRAQRVWLAWGEEDRLRRAVPLFAPLLEPSQMLERPGGHTWSVWSPAATEIFTRVRAARAPAATAASAD